MYILSKIFLLICVFGLILGLSSCKENEGPVPQLSNQILLGDSLKPIENTKINDFDPFNLLETFLDTAINEKTHWIYDLSFTDGEYVLSDNGVLYEIQNATYAVMISILSAGTEDIQHGNFKINESFSKRYLKEKIDENLFIGEFIYDSNGDGVLDVYLEDSFIVNGGTLTTSGTGKDFEIDFNLRLYEDHFLKGSYSGDYLYRDLN